MAPNGGGWVILLRAWPLIVEIGVSPRRINEIVHGKRAITADTALRLARFLN